MLPYDRKEVTLRLIKEKGFYNRPTTGREEEAVKIVLKHWESGGLVL